MQRILVILLLCVPLGAAPQVTFRVDPGVGSPAVYGIERLRQALAISPANGEVVVVAGLAPSGEAAAELKRLKVTLPKLPEALVIRRTQIQGKPAVVLCGADARGLMYAALGAAERVGWARGGDALAEIRDTEEAPYLEQRAVSMYTMQRVYFESRLHDPEHWARYFDLLAASRINCFIVIFGYENGGFMAPLYPFFFDVESFPGVRLVGITPAEQRRNTADFKAMIRAAHERGIEVSAGIWDHIYRGGVQGGGIPGASEQAGKEVPGLVAGVTTENLNSYTKAALAKFIDVFPELDGIQFRMHDESGLKPVEMQSFWHEVFGMLKQKQPALRVDLRAKGLPDEIIADALDQGLKIRVNTKFWMEQVGLPFHPTHINRQDQTNRRHGYADLLRYPQRYIVHWQLWTAGTTRLLLWADPEYVRRFAESARLYGGNSFEVNEMLATKMLGEPHDAAPRPIHSARYIDYKYEFERYWHFYQLWGLLGYNPKTPDDAWLREFERRFGAAPGRELMGAIHLASGILPRIVAASYRYSDFPTTRGWAEMMRGGDLTSYAGEEGSDIEQFLGAREEAQRIVQGGETTKRRPQETSRWFTRVADNVLASVARAEKLAGEPPTPEFVTTTTDLKMLAWLARYHAARLPAGVSYNLFKLTGDQFFLDDAIAYEKEAVAAWRMLVQSAGDVYSSNLAFGPQAVGFSRHWKEELAKLEEGLARLAKERANVSSSPASKVAHRRAMEFDTGQIPPVVRLLPVKPPKPGQPMDVAARVEGQTALKTLRLRYRHLTQFEDYRAVPMTLDPASGLYTASIPGDFITSQWDLIYFVEASGPDGGGRNYPDLEEQTPYVVVKLAR